MGSWGLKVYCKIPQFSSQEVADGSSVTVPCVSYLTGWEGNVGKLEDGETEQRWTEIHLPSLKLTFSLWKWMVGILVSLLGGSSQLRYVVNNHAKMSQEVSKRLVSGL